MLRKGSPGLRVDLFDEIRGKGKVRAPGLNQYLFSGFYLQRIGDKRMSQLAGSLVLIHVPYLHNKK